MLTLEDLSPGVSLAIDGYVDSSSWTSGTPPQLDGLPRFLELQDELRDVLSTGIAQLVPNQETSNERLESFGFDDPPSFQHDYDFSRVSIPRYRLICYLTNWITDCAPLLDKFDAAKHFAIQVPIIAQRSPALLYAILAFSARQCERRRSATDCSDSLELYQAAITLLAPSLQTRDQSVPVIACVLACLELMSGRSKDWRRHVEGCATLFEIFNVNGFVGGVWQAVFWCYARMDLCGSIISDGSQSTVLPLSRWVPSDLDIADEEEKETAIDKLFHQRGHGSPEMHANCMMYLCARVSDLVYRRTQSLALDRTNGDDSEYLEPEWNRLWRSLHIWLDRRPAEMLPVETAGGSDDLDFPKILFIHWAAISANQMYHTACMLMLQINPGHSSSFPAQELTPRYSAQWHARRICGISMTNPHTGSLVNGIQPLFIAGKILSHPTQHVKLGRIFVTIEKLTGWGAIWRLSDLEKVWVRVLHITSLRLRCRHSLKQSNGYYRGCVMLLFEMDESVRGCSNLLTAAQGYRKGEILRMVLTEQ